MADQKPTKIIPPRDIKQEIRERGGQGGAKPLPGDPYHILNLTGLIETTEVAPTLPPKTFYDSIKIVVDDIASPSTYELYIYSKEIGAWLKATLAAA